MERLEEELGEDSQRVADLRFEAELVTARMNELFAEAEAQRAELEQAHAEELAGAQAEVRQLRAASARSDQARDTATGQQLAALETENRRLREQLRDAEEKLEAITTIERSIREQE